MRAGEPYPMEIDHQALIENAKRTIRNIESAIVELVTNSNDAYKSQGYPEGKEIWISVKFNQKNQCTELSVWDAAGGMSTEKLKQALIYGKRQPSSDIEIIRRGYHGRGLKETIIALGEGHVRTIHNGTPSECYVKIEGNKVQIIPMDELSSDDTREWKISDNGTEVTISISNEKISTTPPKNLPERLSKHFELREIVKRHQVTLSLSYYDKRKKSSIKNKQHHLKWEDPQGELVENRALKDNMVLTLYESKEPLEIDHDDHYSTAGITITAEDVPIDRRVFYKERPGVDYFYGSLEVPSLAKRIRGGKADEIRTDRGGLDWRHVTCKQIEEEVKNVLQDHYERRASSPQPVLNKRLKENLSALTKEINKIAKELIESLEDLDPVPVGPKGQGSTTPPNSFCIRPAVAYELPGKKREFTVYASKALLLPRLMHKETPKVSILLIPDRKDHQRWFKNPSSIELQPSKEYKQHYSGNIQITIDQAAELGTEVTIVAQIRDETIRETANAKLKIAQPTTRPSSVGKQGLFSEISPNPQLNPSQPVLCDNDTKKMIIYTKFPVFGEAVGEEFEKAGTDRGIITLSYLVTEGLCRRIITIAIEKGRLKDDFDVSLREFDKLRKEAIQKVQKVVQNIFKRPQK